MIPREESFVLAVDLGTGGPKVGLVSVTGEIAWHDHLPVKTRWLEGGGAVQDADEWWHLVLGASGRALASGTVPPHNVVGVSVTGQWASTVPVDAGGAPVGDCVMWMDTRGARHARRVVGGPVGGYSLPAATTWIRRCGAPPSPHGDDSLGHMLFLEKDQPQVASAARWYLEPVDYLSMRFSGVAAASPASSTAMWLTDTRQRCIRDYDPVLVRLSGVNPSKLPPLRATGSVVGRLRADLARELGLSPDVCVVTGTPDLHSAAVGAGAVLDYEPHMAIGTTSWISCPVRRKKTDLIHQMATVPGLTDGGYLIANNQDSAGRCLEWLRDDLAGPGQGLGGGPVDYGHLARMASLAAPGSGGVIFGPWLTGERSPVADRRARAGFHNLSIGTTQSDLIRAVLEGVAYNSRWLLEGTEKFTGRRLDPIRLIGGGARLDIWCRILADVLDRRVERVSDPWQANLRGAALIAGMALGYVHRDEVRSLVQVDETFQPDPANRRVYDRLFAEFPGLYRAQRGLFHRLNRPMASSARPV